MEIISVVRFTVPAEDEQEMRRRRDVLITAARRHSPGLRHAVLTQVDEKTWMDVWHWDSEESMVSTQEARLPEAAAGFELVEVVDLTVGRIVTSA